jgi:hypothetical protein
MQAWELPKRINNPIDGATMRSAGNAPIQVGLEHLTLCCGLQMFAVCMRERRPPEKTGGAHSLISRTCVTCMHRLCELLVVDHRVCANIRVDPISDTFCSQCRMLPAGHCCRPDQASHGVSCCIPGICWPGLSHDPGERCNCYLPRHCQSADGVSTKMPYHDRAIL